MIRATVAAALAFSTLSACIGDETVAAYGAADRVWTVTEIDGVAFTTRATLRFPEYGTIAGQAPCNSYTATMTSPYPWFDAQSVAATQQACPDSASEAAYFSALTAMTLSEVLADTLILSTPEGRSMVFKADG